MIFGRPEWRGSLQANADLRSNEHCNAVMKTGYGTTSPGFAADATWGLNEYTVLAIVTFMWDSTHRLFSIGNYSQVTQAYDWGAMYINASGQLVFFYTNGNYIESSRVFGNGVRHRITYAAAMNSPGNFHMQLIDNELQGSTTGQPGAVGTNFGFRMGDHWANSSTAHLEWESVWLYNRALSIPEVRNVLNHPYEPLRSDPRSRVFMGIEAAPAGLGIPIAMHHYRQMRGAA